MGEKISVLILSSKKDSAGKNIKEAILDLSNWKEINVFNKNPVYKNPKLRDVYIITINDEAIKHENLDEEIEKKLNIKPKQAIFISKHKSESGKPTLTTHPIGNYGEAKFGGKTKTLTKASPKFMTELLRIIKKNAELAKTYHQVCFEVTHHGPFLRIPTLFTEVGSTEEEWIKKTPAEVIAKSVLELLNKHHYEEDISKDIPVLIGIGGGHYAPRFTDIVLEKKVAFGHMIPTYQIKNGNINREIIKKTIEATPNITGVYLHKKSLKKSQVTDYKKIFEEMNLPVVSSKELTDL